MITIKSIQKREPKSNSYYSSSDFSTMVFPKSFNVKANDEDIKRITIFFPCPDNDALGVGLELSAPEAIALGHAL